MTTPDLDPSTVTAENLATARVALSLFQSMLVGRRQFWTRAGKTHLQANNTYRRDVWGALGYPDRLQYEDYRETYERGDIAERIVEAKPDATWSGDIIVTDNEDPAKETELSTAIRDLFEELDLWDVLYRADVLANIGQYSAIMLGLPGNLTHRRNKSQRVYYAMPYGEGRAIVEEHDWETRSTNPRFGLPRYYTIEVGEGANTATQRRVHWSRIVHVAEGLLDDRVFGKPILRSIWNRLIDLEKLVGGGSEAAWKRMDPGMHIKMDPEMEPNANEIKAFNDEMEEYEMGLRRWLRTRGLDIDLLNTQVAGFSGNGEFILKLISSATGIPSRILTGSERGQLASDQDRNNWNDRVKTRRLRFAAPLVLGIVKRLQDLGVLPQSGSRLRIHWPRVGELDEFEVAEVISKIAIANQAQEQSEGSVILSAGEIRTRFLGVPAEISYLSERYRNRSSDGSDSGSEQPLNGRVQEEDTSIGSVELS